MPSTLLEWLEAENRRWEQIEAEEAQRLRRGISRLINEFGPDLLETWDAQDSPRLNPRLGRTVRLVYVGEFTQRARSREQSEPERIYANTGELVILYLGDDYRLYAYEAYGESPTRSLGIHRLDLENEDRYRLSRFHEEFLAVGLR